MQQGNNPKQGQLYQINALWEVLLFHLVLRNSNIKETDTNYYILELGLLGLGTVHIWTDDSTCNLVLVPKGCYFQYLYYFSCKK